MRDVGAPGHFNEGVMKTTNFSSPKHGAVTYLTREELRDVAAHWKMDFTVRSAARVECLLATLSIRIEWSSFRHWATGEVGPVEIESHWTWERRERAVVASRIPFIAIEPR